MTVIQIMSESMITKYDSPPLFTDEERKRFGYIPLAIQKIADEIRAPHNRLGFLMNYFYFRVMGRFYPSTKFNPKDVQAVTQKYSLGNADLSNYSSSTNTRHQQIICEEVGFRRIDEETRKELTHITRELCKKQMRSRVILGQLVDWLFENKIVGLSYYPLAEIVTNGINAYQDELLILLDSHLTTPVRTALDLLVGINLKAESSEDNLLALRDLANYSHSRSPKGISENCEKLAKLQELLNLFPPIEQIPVSPESIRYYAEATLAADTHQLVRRSENRYLFLYCFLVHQRRIFQDVLTDTILLTCQGRETMWKTKKHEAIIHSYEYRSKIFKIEKQRAEDMKSAMASMAVIMKDRTIDDKEQFTRIKAIIEASCQLDDVAEIALLSAKESDHVEIDANPYHFEEKDSKYLQNRISTPIKLFDFDKDSSSPILYEAVAHYKTKKGNVTGTAPMRFMSDKEILQVRDEKGKFRISLYKVFLFKAVIKGIKSGNLNLCDSYKYRSLESYQIDLERWKCNQQQILEDAGLLNFALPVPILESLKSELYSQRVTTESNLRTGVNSKARLDSKMKVILETPATVKNQTNRLTEFFPDHGSVALFQMLATIDAKAKFTECLEYKYVKNAKKQPTQTALFAAVIAFGCNIGIPQMGQMLKNVSREDLEYASQWYFSPENIEAANNAVLALISEFQLSDVYKTDSGKTHTSSDGQKFTVAVESLHASYSHKYFGTQKGVSIYSFIDQEHKLYSSTVMVPSEREAAYVIDGLMANDVVKSDIHSTDTHGYSEIIFAVSHFLDISFAPRIMKVKNQQLYKFETAEEANREGWRMASAGNIDTDLIAKHWDEILRFIATIKLKVTSASQLFKRLNSYSSNHPLYTALRQFGRIIKSIFLLKYIDDVQLRQSIEKQLNRIESYHQFAKAIFFGRNQEVQYATKQEQETSEACKRLIANVIICWNYMYISTAVTRVGSEEQKRVILNAAKYGSMVAWQHVNFHGEYDFSLARLKNRIDFDLDEIRKSNIGELINSL